MQQPTCIRARFSTELGETEKITAMVEKSIPLRAIRPPNL
jgi:hypothetical protein